LRFRLRQVLLYIHIYIYTYTHTHTHIYIYISSVRCAECMVHPGIYIDIKTILNEYDRM